MRREWRPLEEFPKYEVSNLAEFVNARTDNNINPSKSRFGHSKITLTRDKEQLTRSVAQLVAQTFIPQPEEHFDTPIHLNGDLMDCAVANLMWRPRWFAIRYHKQFRYDNFHLDQAHRVEINTNSHYYSMKELCTTLGVYQGDVIESCYQGAPVFPDWWEFELLFEK